MTAYYIAETSIGAAVPGAMTSVQLGAEGINLALPDIEARVTSLLATLAGLAALPPFPDFPAMLVKANALAAQIDIAIHTPGLPPPPSLATAIDALTTLLEALTVSITAINGKLTAIAAFQTLMANAGLHVITYDGPRSNVGIDVQNEINAHVPGSGPIPANTPTYGVALITTNGATWSAMQTVFKVSP